MKDNKHLVIGIGQIGEAIKNILNADSFDIKDGKNENTNRKYEAIHICFPYNKDFEKEVLSYQNRFLPDITIIHSTVPVGISEKLKSVHSPCRGIHPHLEKGIRTFVKYFGGDNSEKASEYFSKIGITIKTFPSSRTTEAMKLWDTTIYGWNIVLEKAIFSYCKKNNIDFDSVYTEASRTYNEGYEKLGYPEYKKYILRHVNGKIGGHCVINNLNLLDSEISQIIKNLNDKESV